MLIGALPENSYRVLLDDRGNLVGQFSREQVAGLQKAVFYWIRKHQNSSQG